MLHTTSTEQLEYHLDMGLWEYNLDSGQVNLSNYAARELGLGNKAHRLTIKQLLQLVHANDRDAFVDAIHRSPKGNNAIKLEFRLANGTPYYQWVFIKGRRASDPSTGTPFIIGMARDVTESMLYRNIQNCMRDLLKELLQHREKGDTLARLCQSVNDVEPQFQCVIFLRDKEPEQALQHAPNLRADLKSVLQGITLVDPQSELQYTYQKRKPLYIAELHRLKSWQTTTQIGIKRSTRTYIGQTIYSSDNKIRGAIALYLPNDNIPLSLLEDIISVIHDIATITIEDGLQQTEQMQIQQQLYHSQKMDSIGHLTGGIAHDFNNVLGSIVGYNSLSKKVVKTLDHPKLNDYLNEVGTAAERARGLINQMIAFSRSQSQSHTLVEAGVIVREVLRMMRSIIPTSIIIHTSISRDCPMIKINATSLHQVILNHVVNAKDAIQDDIGNIYIKMYPVYRFESNCHSCRDAFKGNYVAIEITDDGSGIPTEIRNKIFELFYTSKDEGKGTGMGLNVVHSILHQVGAHITVDSIPDEGSTFTLYFPEAKQEETLPSESEAKTGSDGPQGQGQHIMVIDDDLPLSCLFEEILSSNGYRVSRFNQPAIALKAFTSAPESYDLILSDFTMPKMTGDQLAKKMRSINPSVSFIICTGYSKKLVTETAEAMGFDRVIYKPVDVNQLLTHINDFFQTEEYS